MNGKIKEKFKTWRNYYFSPKDFEKKNNWKIYEKLGVKKFQSALMGTIGRILPKNYWNWSNYHIWKTVNKETLNEFINRTKFNESVHVIGVLMCTLSALSATQNLGNGGGGERYSVPIYLYGPQFLLHNITKI